MGRLKLRGKAMVTAGILCILAALLLLFYNIWDDARAGIASRKETDRLIEEVLDDGSRPVPSIQELIGDIHKGAADGRDMPEKVTDGVSYVAIISIPEINIELSVRSSWDYAGLKQSPCRYSGSAYRNDLVICGHNYTQHFGKLSDLKEGSRILLVDMEGILLTYRVVQVETVWPTEVSRMVDSDYDLSLFTCTLNGRARVTVRCMRENGGA